MTNYEIPNFQRIADKSAIAEYKNDLESMTDKEIDGEINSVRNELDELESWFEALIAWQRRNL